MKIYKVGNYICIVGNNAKENWELLEQAEPNHLFFHLTSFPSCYVILQTEEKVGINIIETCSRVCLENTKYDSCKNVNVDYTKISNVKKGEKVGEIEYISNRKVEKIKI